MITVLAVLLSPVWAFPLTWVIYVFATHLKRQRDYLRRYGEEFHPFVKIVAYPVIGLGYVLDVYLNLILFTILLREIPKEWIVSERLDRHIGNGIERTANAPRPEPLPVWRGYRLRHDATWRSKFCWRFSKALILPFDQKHYRSVGRYWL